MGGNFSFFLGSEENYKQTKAVERELELVAQHTSYDVEELRELHTAFLAQYPTGYISPQQFIDENTEAIGGPPELWQHYFAQVSAAPLTRRRPLGNVPGMNNVGVGVGLGSDPAATDENNTSASPDQKSKSGGGGGSAARGDGRRSGAAAATGGPMSMSERLQAANRAKLAADNDDNAAPSSSSAAAVTGGASGNKSGNAAAPAATASTTTAPAMRTSLVHMTDPTEELDLDPRIVGLSFAHVMIRIHRSTYSPSEQKLKHLFSFFDINQDGLISQSDLETAFGWLFQVPLVRQTAAFADLSLEQRDPGVRAMTLMRVWDRAGTGFLTQDDWVDMGRSDPTLLELLTALRR